MTNAEMTILSLIAEKPRHGYEIEQVIEEREMRNWTEVGFSSIYYVLKKLEKRGFLEGKSENAAGRGPARKVYRLTPAGLEAFHKAMMKALSSPIPPYSTFLLGLSRLQEIPMDDALHALRQYRQKMIARAEHLRTRWSLTEAHSPFNVNALFDLSMTLIDAELSWVTDFIHQLEQREQSNGQNRFQEAT
jgi:DNA-binding PadR family transcriptional regulator